MSSSERALPTRLGGSEPQAIDREPIVTAGSQWVHITKRGASTAKTCPRHSVDAMGPNPGAAGIVRSSGKAPRPPRLKPVAATRVVTPAVGPSLVLLSCLSLQVGATVASALFSSVGVLETGALRFLLGAGVLAAMFRPRLRRRDRREWAAIAAYGVVMLAMNICLYEAIDRISLGLVVTLQFAGPFTLVLLRTRRRLDLMWGLAAAAGVVLLAGSVPSDSLTGVTFALAAAAITAASLLLGADLGARTSGLDGLVLAVGVAALISSPVAFHATASLNAAHVIPIAAVAALTVAIPYSLEYVALRRVGVKAMGVLLSLDPAIGALAGLVVLGQMLTAGQVAGVILVTIASIGVSARIQGQTLTRH